MIYQKSGFTLLEVVISIMISAMLMTVSLTIYQQISKSGQRVEKTTHLDTQIMILYKRLSTDLAGLTPLWFNKELYEKLEKSKKNESEKEASANIGQNSGPNKRNNFLYAQSSNNFFDILTFVTTNPLQVFGDKQIHCARIVYTLQPDTKILGTFKLMRKEDDTISADFDIEKLKTGKLIEIAHKITSCSIQYGFIKQEKDQDKQNKIKEFTFVSEWGQQQNQEKEEDKKPALPDVIKMSLKVQYHPEQEETTYELFCPIPTSQSEAITSFAQKRQEEEKQKKPAQQQPEKIEPHANTTSSGIHIISTGAA